VIAAQGESKADKGPRGTKGTSPLARWVCFAAGVWIPTRSDRHLRGEIPKKKGSRPPASRDERETSARETSG
jgi:hypothetical protein